MDIYKQLKQNTMTKKQQIIIEALKECRQNLNRIKNDLGATENEILINFLKKERKSEYENFKFWTYIAKHEINYYNVNADFKDKVKNLIQSKSEDTTLNYMM